jgi:hypothetical protein
MWPKTLIIFKKTLTSNLNFEPISGPIIARGVIWYHISDISFNGKVRHLFDDETAPLQSGLRTPEESRNKKKQQHCVFKWQFKAGSPEEEKVGKTSRGGGAAPGSGRHP